MGLGSGCRQVEPNEKTVDAASNRITTTSYPLQYLAQRLVGDAITVECPAAESENPRVWQPTSSDIERMQKSDLIITGGPALPYAEWISKVSLPESKICSCSKALKISEYVHIEDYRVVHQHGPEGEHSHALLIPYSWLDPAMAKKQAGYIAKRISAVYPELSESIESNLQVLTDELSHLVDELGTIKTDNRKLLFTSPNLSFLARALNTENDYLLWIETSVDDAEEAKREEELNTRVAESESLLLVANEFSRGTVETASQKQPVTVVFIDSLDHKPDNGDYISEMTSFVSRLNEKLN